MKQEDLMNEKKLNLICGIMSFVWFKNLDVSLDLVFFRDFCSNILNYTQTSISAILLALYYVRRFRISNPLAKPGKGSEAHVFLVALIMSSKYLEDNTYTTKSWSDVTKIPLADLNTMQREFLNAIDHKLFVEPSVYSDWVLQIRNVFALSSSSLVGCVELLNSVLYSLELSVLSEDHYTVETASRSGANLNEALYASRQPQFETYDSDRRIQTVPSTGSCEDSSLQTDYTLKRNRFVSCPDTNNYFKVQKEPVVYNNNVLDYGYNTANIRASEAALCGALPCAQYNPAGVYIRKPGGGYYSSQDVVDAYKTTLVNYSVGYLDKGFHMGPFPGYHSNFIPGVVNKGGNAVH
ncbi:G1/S-specific cyclin pas1 [Zancudomyces culisetae]|uniref:G1/S-specific cyclin pas1 n=1 Tax=Zancudomyces culisetae TaxID=1213189 RepID=A0A1R1PYL9_ZANCU|nr:G1/S-specific cyclin pas1 [Zancudomyces culisetae]|eukprot:OMH86062.1 G1/S-specific cyclin pas1 [Zancudomyces culisetae]